MSKPKRPQTNLEESFNSISHGLTAVASIVGFVYLINLSLQNPQNWKLFSALVYGLSLIALYSFSALYHFVKDEKQKRFYKILDHSGIFLLIAGSYTPVLLLSMRGDIGFSLLANGSWQVLASSLKYFMLVNLKKPLLLFMPSWVGQLF